MKFGFGASRRAHPIIAALERLRLHQGLSGTRIAAKLGCHPSLLYYWRHGESGPSLEMVDGYAGMLGVRLALVDGDGKVVDVPGLYLPADQEKKR